MSAETQLSTMRAGKYLTFKLGSEEYGIVIMKVKTIIGLMEITRVPRTPKFVRGVINLRGQIIPIMDMRKKFGMESVDDTRETTIIVVEVEKSSRLQEIGIVVDSVSEVMDISHEQIDNTPEFGSGFDSEFIMGMAKARGRVISLLSIEKILSTEDMLQMEKTAAEKSAEKIKGDH